MPPTETDSPITSQSPAPKSGIKKRFKLFILIILIVGGIWILGETALGVWVGIIIPNLERSKLVTQTEKSPDVVVSTYQCSSADYQWQILERDDVYPTPLFEAPKLYRYRIPALVYKGQVIADRGNSSPARAFPAAEPFVKAYIVSRNIFEPNQGPWAGADYRYIEVPSSSISISDADLVAKCLGENVGHMNEDLKQNPVKYHPIGWILLVDKDIFREPEPTYICADSTVAHIWGGLNIQYYSPGDVSGSGTPVGSGGWVTVDGTVHPSQANPAAPGGADPGTVLRQCVDEGGTSMIDRIRSIPSRIQFLDLPDHGDLVKGLSVLATIDSSSLTSSSQHPIISGSATGVSSVFVSLADKGEVFWRSDPVQVVNGRWSVAVSISKYKIPIGQYIVLVDGPDNSNGVLPDLARGTLILR
jgi:hypothetical protein